MPEIEVRDADVRVTARPCSTAVSVSVVVQSSPGRPVPAVVVSAS